MLVLMVKNPTPIFPVCVCDSLTANRHLIFILKLGGNTWQTTAEKSHFWQWITCKTQGSKGLGRGTTIGFYDEGESCPRREQDTCISGGGALADAIKVNQQTSITPVSALFAE